MAPFSFNLSKVRSYLTSGFSLPQDAHKVNKSSPGVAWIHSQKPRYNAKHIRHLPSLKSLRTTFYPLKLYKTLNYQRSSTCRYDLDGGHEDQEQVNGSHSPSLWSRKVHFLAYHDSGENDVSNRIDLHRQLHFGRCNTKDCRHKGALSFKQNVSNVELNKKEQCNSHVKVWSKTQGSGGRRKASDWKSRGISSGSSSSANRGSSNVNKQEAISQNKARSEKYPYFAREWSFVRKSESFALMQPVDTEKLLKEDGSILNLDERVRCSLRTPPANVLEETFWAELYEREQQQFEIIATLPHVMTTSKHSLHGLITMPKESKYSDIVSSVDSTNISQVSTQDSSHSSQTQLCCSKNGLKGYEDDSAHCISSGSSTSGFRHAQSRKIFPFDHCSLVTKDMSAMKSRKTTARPIIRSDVRESLIKWMRSITVNMKWAQATFFIATNTFDSYLAYMAIDAWVPRSLFMSNSLPLLCTACLFLGVVAVEEHTHAYRVKSFIKEVPNITTIEEIFTQQLDILGCLTSGLLVTRTPEDFLYYYLANMKFSFHPTFKNAYVDLLCTKTEIPSFHCAGQAPIHRISLKSFIDCILTLISLAYEIGFYMVHTSSAFVMTSMVPLLASSVALDLTSDFQFFEELALHIFKLDDVSKLIHAVYFLLPSLRKIAGNAFDKDHQILYHFIYAASDFQMPCCNCSEG